MLKCRSFPNAENSGKARQLSHSRITNYSALLGRHALLASLRRPHGECISTLNRAALVHALSQLVESPALPHDATDGFDPEALAAAAGVQHLVRCGPTPLGRGLVSSTPLERQAIVSVPLQNALVITDEPLSGISVFGDRCQELWQQHHGRLPQELRNFLTGDARWDVRMTAWLLWVASELPDSPVWGPYMASLPRAEEVTCLLKYGPDDARELQFRELVDEAKSQHNWALAVHRNYFDPQRGELRGLGLATKPEDTMWAMSMVRTRTFSEDVNGEALTLVVPYADMANHSFDFKSTFCMARDNKRFELRLLTSLGDGEEATICYGDSKPNFEVMRDYGFVVPGNPNDRIVLPDQEALPALNGASLLQSLGLEGDWREGKAEIKKIASPPPQQQQQQQQSNRDDEEEEEEGEEARLAHARRRCAVLSMNLSDGFPNAKGGGGLFGGWPAAQPWTDSGRPPPQLLRGGAATVAAERASLANVRQCYQVALNSLPTSIEEDEELLRSWGSGSGSGYGTKLGSGSREAPLTARGEAAVRCRLEHKRLMREAVRALDVYDAWLAERQRPR